MKLSKKTILLLAVIATSLTSCTLWQDDWKECVPLPETEIPVEPDPWEPGGTDEKPIGE